MSDDFEYESYEPTEEEIAQAREHVKLYDDGIDAIDEAVRELHRNYLAESDVTSASVVTAWTMVVATTGFDEGGNTRGGIHVLGPRNVPNWQDVGLLKTGLQTVLDNQ